MSNIICVLLSLLKPLGDYFLKVKEQRPLKFTDVSNTAMSFRSLRLLWVVHNTFCNCWMKYECPFMKLSSGRTPMQSSRGPVASLLFRADVLDGVVYFAARVLNAIWSTLSTPPASSSSHSFTNFVTSFECLKYSTPAAKPQSSPAFLGLEAQ